MNVGSPSCMYRHMNCSHWVGLVMIDNGWASLFFSSFFYIRFHLYLNPKKFRILYPITVAVFFCYINGLWSNCFQSSFFNDERSMHL